MAKDLRDLEAKLKRAAHFINERGTAILEVEGKNFLQQNFQDEGFNDGSLTKWQPRKTVDKRGRDLTRYRTNRRGKAGSLTKYGQKLANNRPILTGHDTGGNKLRHSFKTRRDKNKVVFYTHKKYARRHNEGLDGMPKREFIGRSRTLDKNIEKQLKHHLDKIFNS